MSGGLRLLSIAMITAGLVVVADVAVTLAWKEPLSSIYGTLKQSELGDEVSALERDFPEAFGPSERKLRRDAAALARRLKAESGQGEGIGRIRIPAIGLEQAMVEGTDPGALEQGPGHYSATDLPGAGSTVGIAGHRTTYGAPFRRIVELEGGDEVIVEMPYATLTYEVDEARVVAPSDVEIVRPRKRERLVLTACHPLYSDSERYAVFGDLVEVTEPER
ncbi:MAG: sortase [Solirubrobacterales bacterium]